MLCGQPVDPQPANVHADGEFGRGVPSFESPGEYVPGLRDAPGRAGTNTDIWESHCMKIIRGGNVGKHHVHCNPAICIFMEIVLIHT